MDYKDINTGMSSQHFWAQGKKDFLEILLKKYCSTNRPIRILNVGSGTGNDLEVIKKFGKIDVIDIEQKALDLINPLLVDNKVCGDACEMPYPNNTFDVVIALDVLEHIEQDKKATTEINRVLKNNGIFIFTVPAFNWLYSKHDQYLEHHRRYNKKALRDILSDYKIIQLNYWFCFLFLPAVITRLIGKFSEHVTYEKKPHNIINYFFYNIISIENWLHKKNITTPFGLSIYGITQKKLI